MPSDSRGDSFPLWRFAPVHTGIRRLRADHGQAPGQPRANHPPSDEFERRPNSNGESVPFGRRGRRGEGPDFPVLPANPIFVAVSVRHGSLRRLGASGRRRRARAIRRRTQGNEEGKPRREDGSGPSGRDRERRRPGVGQGKRGRSGVWTAPGRPRSAGRARAGRRGAGPLSGRGRGPDHVRGGPLGRVRRRRRGPCGQRCRRTGRPSPSR